MLYEVHTNFDVYKCILVCVRLHVRVSVSVYVSLLFVH